MIRKLLVTVVLLLSALPLSLNAAVQSVEIGDFVYDLVTYVATSGNEAVIVGLRPGYQPSGTLRIPSSVEYEGQTYSVVGIGWGDWSSHEMDSPAIDACQGITSVYIPKTIEFIADHEFASCPNIEKYIVEDGNKYYKTIDGSLIELHSNDVCYFFRYPSAATAHTFVVPSSTTYISPWAFSSNTHLKTLYIVGEQTLATGWQLGNRSITEIDASNHQPKYTMEDGALYSDTRLITYCPGNENDSFTPREGTNNIGPGAFCNAPLRHVTIPESVISFASNWTFRGSDIETLTMLATCDSGVGRQEFRDCTNLKELTVGPDDNGMVDIGESAFAGCYNLEKVNLAPGVRKLSIGEYAFYDCQSFEGLPLTSTMKVDKLKGYAFYGCGAMTSFSFTTLNSIDELGYQFAGTGLTQVNWPSALTSVPQGCFQNCRDLIKVSLKMTTSKIGRYAFAGSGLTAISMMGANSYYSESFLDCPALNRIYFPLNDNATSMVYWSIPFITGNSHVIVNNPKITDLSRQMASTSTTLYISAVTGGVSIGNGWKELYVPGRAAQLYSNITSSPVKEMYSYETYPEDGAVAISNLIPGIKITSVTIEGVETTLENGRYVAPGVSIQGDEMHVVVNYTVSGNPMTSTYRYAYAGLDDLHSDPEKSVAEKWYNLNGLEVDREHLSPGIYVIIRDGKASKTVVK